MCRECGCGTDGLRAIAVHKEDANRAVEVAETFGPLLDVMNKLEISLVSIEGRFLSANAEDGGELYVCASLPERRDAMRFLTNLISLALDDDGLRDTIMNAGHPRIAEVGDKSLIWWPELRGQPRTIH
jgi:hypothetical protein